MFEVICRFQWNSIFKEAAGVKLPREKAERLAWRFQADSVQYTALAGCLTIRRD